MFSAPIQGLGSICFFCFILFFCFYFVYFLFFLFFHLGLFWICFFDLFILLFFCFLFFSLISALWEEFPLSSPGPLSQIHSYSFFIYTSMSTPESVRKSINR